MANSTENLVGMCEMLEMLEKHLNSVKKRVKNPERKAQIQEIIEGFKQSREDLQNTQDS